MSTRKEMSSPEPMDTDPTAALHNANDKPSNHQHHNRRRRRHIRVALLHSKTHTNVLYQAMKYIHQDRDLLLDALLQCCGFLSKTPKFFDVVSPKLASRHHLERFHDPFYLNVLENPGDGQSSAVLSHSLLESFGLVDDCPLHPSTTAASCSSQADAVVPRRQATSSSYCSDNNILWTYCRHVVGGSLHAAQLLTRRKSSSRRAARSHHDDCQAAAAAEDDICYHVAIHWGGGRHHAHSHKASGFCYVNDVVLAIQHLMDHAAPTRNSISCSGSGASSAVPISLGHEHDERNKQQTQTSKGSQARVLYLDIDIHHADGVQQAFYDTDQVLTVSFHLHSKGFFPSSSGSSKEKGMHGTRGVGYNVNVQVPQDCTDADFVHLYQTTFCKLKKAYQPHAIVLCVGADGLQGDPLIVTTAGKDSGWNLTPQGLAECVRYTSQSCAGTATTTMSTTTAKTSAAADAMMSTTTAAQGNRHDSCEPRSPAGGVTPLLLLGGGGYHAARTARTFVLCTAAACDGARPGMLEELPMDVPRHEYFGRYAPDDFVLWKKRNDDEDDDEEAGESNDGTTNIADNGRKVSEAYESELRKARQEVDLAVMYLQAQKKKNEEPVFGCFEDDDDEANSFAFPSRARTSGKTRPRRKRASQRK